MYSVILCQTVPRSRIMIRKRRTPCEPMRRPTGLLSSKAGRIPEMGIRVGAEQSAFIVPDDCVGYVAKPPDSGVNCVIEKKKGTGTTASTRQREQIYLPGVRPRRQSSSHCPALAYRARR